MFFWRNHLKTHEASSALLLAHKLRTARDLLKLSLDEAAEHVGLSSEVLLALEEGTDGKDSKSREFLMYGYRRIAVLRYIDFLGLPLFQVTSLLPPPPSLNPKGSILFKKNPSLQEKHHSWLKIPHVFSSFPKRFVSISSTFPKFQIIFLKKRSHSLHPVIESLLKFALILVIMIVLFYGWSILRYLNRII